MAGESPDWTAATGAAASRRALLARGGAAAVAAGAAAVGAVTMGAAISRANSPSPASIDETGVNVRDHGAVGDGTADDTARIQKAIDAVRPTGGIVFFPPGTYLTRRLALHSRVHLRGSGGDATVLRLMPGANSAILESDGFAKLTGTRTDGGISRFSVRDLTLDGNKRRNANGGYGIRVYGYDYEITDVIAFNCRGDGVYSEWVPAAGPPAPARRMEARLTGLRSHDNDGYGINVNGPHATFLNCLAFENMATGFRIAGDLPGTVLVNCHGWGLRQHVSFDLAAPATSCVNCFADFNGGVGVRIMRSFCQWIGGLVLGANHPGPAQEIGIQFVPGGRPDEPAGCVIDTKILGCGTAAIDFGADRGLSNVRASLSQPGVRDAAGNPVPRTGLGWIGKPAPTTQVEITEGLGDTENNLVIRPAFDLRAQAAPSPPQAATVRVFTRKVGGKTQLCALFPNGAVQVMATEP
jgi:hypothetical protein